MIIPGTILQLGFSNQQAFLLADLQLPLKQIELGPVNIVYTSRKNNAWLISVIETRENGTILVVEVSDYNLPFIEFPLHQQKLQNDLVKVKKIQFIRLDTAGLLQSFRQTNIQIETGTVFNPIPEKILPIVSEKLPQPPREIQESFTIAFQELEFILGGVRFLKKLNDFNKPVEITITNYELRGEFDAVRNYFSNVLNTKRIDVRIRAKLNGEEITIVEARSPQIDKINKEIIENVKFEFVQNSLKKKHRPDIEVNLLTMEEYFKHYGEEKLRPNAFFENENKLFENILSIKQTKHYHHLRFLSQHHVHNIMKLRFVHTPLSFVFLLQGERHYHLVWETLDTKEATYIWHCDKTIEALKNQVRKIEDIINIVKVQGKNAYINSSDDQFRRIYHDYSALQHGFLKWKNNLESYLT